MLKLNLDEYDDLAIRPVISPFLSFIICMVAVHYFCFSLWPLTWWQICVKFDLLNGLTTRAFLNFASGVSFSTGAMMFLLFIAAGYDTTSCGGAKQIFRPGRISRFITDRLNDCVVRAVLLYLMLYGAFFIIGAVLNPFSATKFGMLPQNLSVLAVYALPSFSSYYEIVNFGVRSLICPFGYVTLFFSLLYFLLRASRIIEPIVC
jgi:hypothetical protein